ncbi:membrane-spanning 4-domains subfamily A member 4A-like [Pseudophryne corroboree]|uniref:membrane-spanning 4-domains subfamily A member 4A-like n=1 Tax=Pseudophryne corroboree TaxID=495146 RepID=UPI003081A073
MPLYTASEAKTYAYNTLLQDAPSSIPTMNASVTTSYQYVSPQPQDYNVSLATQACNVPPEVPQWSVAAVVPQNIDVLTAYIRTFLKGKPKILGIVLIVAGILQLILGIAMAATMPWITAESGIPFWGSVFYIIAGSLSIAAQNKPNICLVKGAFSLNIISIPASLIAVILNSFDLAQNAYCYNYKRDAYGSDWSARSCSGRIVVTVLLILINLLVFSVSLSISIFGCRSLSRVPINVTQVFVLQKDGVTAMNPSTHPAASQLPPPDTVRTVHGYAI